MNRGQIKTASCVISKIYRHRHAISRRLLRTGIISGRQLKNLIRKLGKCERSPHIHNAKVVHVFYAIVFTRTPFYLNFQGWPLKFFALRNFPCRKVAHVNNTQAESMEWSCRFVCLLCACVGAENFRKPFLIPIYFALAVFSEKFTRKPLRGYRVLGVHYVIPIPNGTTKQH